jgi:hypothetical protein
MASEKGTIMQAAAKLARMPRETRKGLVQVGVSLDAHDLELLREEAFRRARAAGTGRPDTSALIRLAISEWLARLAKRKP